MIMQIVIATVVASRIRNSLSKLSSNPVLLSNFCGEKPWGVQLQRPRGILEMHIVYEIRRR
jgi:hypothetical protein